MPDMKYDRAMLTAASIFVALVVALVAIYFIADPETVIPPIN
jgi:hypothetical protein